MVLNIQYKHANTSLKVSGARGTRALSAMAHQLKNPKYFSGFRRSKIPDGIWNGISLGFGLCYMLYQQIHTKICIFFYWCAANKIEFIVQLWYVDKYKTNKGTMVGWSQSLGQSPSNYNFFYHT